MNELEEARLKRKGQVACNLPDIPCPRYLTADQIRDNHNPSDRYILADQLQPLIDERDTLKRAIMAARKLFESLDKGSTHWDGCESCHPVCAWFKATDSFAVNPEAQDAHKP